MITTPLRRTCKMSQPQQQTTGSIQTSQAPLSTMNSFHPLPILSPTTELNLPVPVSVPCQNRQPNPVPLSRRRSTLSALRKLKSQALQPISLDEYTTFHSRSGPKYRLTKPVTHQLEDGKIITLLPGDIVRLVGTESRKGKGKEKECEGVGKCRILAVYEGDEVRLGVWRDFFGEEPLRKADGRKMIGWKTLMKGRGWVGKKVVGLGWKHRAGDYLTEARQEEIMMWGE
jgi:hypothetical protein